jgi:hypothetical protein
MLSTRTTTELHHSPDVILSKFYPHNIRPALHA